MRRRVEEEGDGVQGKDEGMTIEVWGSECTIDLTLPLSSTLHHLQTINREGDDE